MTSNKAEIEGLYTRAKEQTLSTLPKFLESVSAMSQTRPNYDKSVDAVAISAIAASWAMESEPGMGMSGASAMYVIHSYMMRYGNISTPAKIVEYKEMLYPNSAKHFEKTLSSETWAVLQATAAERLRNAPSYMAAEVRAHLQSIVDGVPPFGYVVEDD